VLTSSALLLALCGACERPSSRSLCNFICCIYTYKKHPKHSFHTGQVVLAVQWNAIRLFLVTAMTSCHEPNGLAGINRTERLLLQHLTKQATPACTS
jgi:hypothetical protein